MHEGRASNRAQGGGGGGTSVDRLHHQVWGECDTTRSSISLTSNVDICKQVYIHSTYIYTFPQPHTPSAMRPWREGLPLLLLLFII